MVGRTKSVRTFSPGVFHQRLLNLKVVLVLSGLKDLKPPFVGGCWSEKASIRAFRYWILRPSNLGFFRFPSQHVAKKEEQKKEKKRISHLELAFSTEHY